MIQSTVVRAIYGRSDKFFWPIVTDDVRSITGITRCVMVCNQDGADTVIIDSDEVPSAFDFAATGVVRGRLVTGMSWQLGKAIQSAFTESGSAVSIVDNAADYVVTYT